MNGSAALECAGPKSLGSTIGTGKLEVDLDKRLVTVDGNPVKLTQRESEILPQGHDRDEGDVSRSPLCRRARAGAQDHRYLRL